jgi:hypothetical protein
MTSIDAASALAVVTTVVMLVAVAAVRLSGTTRLLAGRA